MSTKPLDIGQLVLDAANSAGMASRQLRKYAQDLEPYSPVSASHLRAAADSADKVAGGVAAMIGEALAKGKP